MSIVPDTKDWTWVLQQPCPECGFDAARVDVDTLPERVRSLSRRWVLLLNENGEQVRRRPEAQVWSPLEYGCHVRDVLRIFDGRLELMLTQDDPAFPDWDQNRTAVDEAYADQDPRTVAEDLVTAGDRIADRFAGVRGAGWQRPGRRSNGSVFTVDTFARYFLHDLVHHAHDVSLA